MAGSFALSGKKILLGVTGSIAAYKAPLLVRLLQKSGADVRVILTNSAQKFITETTFRGLGCPVESAMWSAPGELHVDLASWADLFLIAPATADSLARLAQGRADSLLTATALCLNKAPLVVAPAMHPNMWHHPATTANTNALKERGVHFIGPGFGEVASGDEGLGRLEEPECIAEQLGSLLVPRSLLGKHIVITAGPTHEAIDPVRSLTNSSSGKMGYALAEAARDLGANVSLISGKVSLAPPSGVNFISVTSTLDMQKALHQILGVDLKKADALIMAAAVSDYRPAQESLQKLKRTKSDLQLHLIPNPDILGTIGKKRWGAEGNSSSTPTSSLPSSSRPRVGRPILIGFALETASGDELIELAQGKLHSKKVDLIVANQASESLGKDDNLATLVDATSSTSLKKMPKSALAHQILDWLKDRL